MSVCTISVIGHGDGTQGVCAVLYQSSFQLQSPRPESDIWGRSVPFNTLVGALNILIVDGA